METNNEEQKASDQETKDGFLVVRHAVIISRVAEFIEIENSFKQHDNNIVSVMN